MASRIQKGESSKARGFVVAEQSMEGRGLSYREAVNRFLMGVEGGPGPAGSGGRRHRGHRVHVRDVPGFGARDRRGAGASPDRVEPGAFGSHRVRTGGQASRTLTSSRYHGGEGFDSPPPP